MRTLRRHRRWLVPWLAAALLWAQWLTAAYACPQTRPVQGDAGPAAVVSMAAMAPMTACAEHGPAAMDPAQPQLCKAHCEAGQQSVNSQAGALDAPPAPVLCAALVGVVALAEPACAGTAWADARAAGPGPPRGTPPLYLSLLVLRN